MSEPELRREELSLAKQAVPLPPDLYIKTLEDKSMPEWLKRQLWGVVSKLLAQSYIEPREVERYIHHIEYVILLAMMSFPPKTLKRDWDIFINYAMARLHAELLIRRSVNGFERSTMLGYSAREVAPPRKPSLLERLFGGGKR